MPFSFRAFPAMAVAFALLAAVPAALRAQNPVPSASPVPAPSATPSASPTPDSLAELTASLLTAETQRGEIDGALRDEEPLAALKTKTEALTKKIAGQLDADGDTLDANPSLATVEALSVAWKSRDEELSAFAKSLRERADRYDAQGKDLANLQKTWGPHSPNDKTAKGGSKAKDSKDAPKEGDGVMYPEQVERISALLRAAEANRKTIQQRRGELAPLLESTQKQEWEVDRMIARIKEVGPQAFGRLFVMESVPVWSSTLWSKTLWQNTGFNLASETRAAWTKEYGAAVSYAQGKESKVLSHGFLFVILLTALFWARRRVRDWIGDDERLSRAAQVFEAPISMAIVFSLLAAQGIYQQPPPLLAAIGGAAALIPAVLILRRLLDRHLFPVLNAMVVFYFLDQVRRVAVALPIAARFLFLAEMAGCALFAAWFLASRRLRDLRAQNPRLAKVTYLGAQGACAVFAASFVANAIGGVELGGWLGNLAFQSACLAVVLYAATRVANGLIAGVLSSQLFSSVRMVRNHRTLLWQRIHRLFDVAALLFWVVETINLVPGHSAFWETAQSFLYSLDKKGDVQWKLLGQVLAFGAVVWGSFLFSRFIRFMLEEELYPRVRMERGLSYAVSTVFHYAVLLIGFYTAAAWAGIDMTKFNILVGAFGVGMGFGLQNIINNFVSGVILLFERPIKVGDVVQMSDASGTVDRIGIRASIIRTGSGSEIIVPNGKLISDQVTNWTLSNRLRGIELPVSVAEGVDPCRVIELLKGIAAAHPQVCKQPAPNALLLELGTDVLQFKLTAWTERYDQWGQIRSDLAIAVHAALTKEGIRRAAPAAVAP